jgi:hypothetical protein
MRVPILTTFALLACVAPAGAADLSKVDRTLKEHPTFRSSSPRFCLLVFGPEARTRVWLVRDGDALHARLSPDGKAPPVWRHFPNARFAAAIGDVWEEGGKARHQHLRYAPGQAEETLSVHIDGKLQQTAGLDRSGGIEFAPDPEDAPIVHFNGPVTLDLFRAQRPLWTGRRVNMTAVVGTHGLGKGTFATFRCGGYLQGGASPIAVIAYPGQDAGKPIVETVRLADD